MKENKNKGKNVQQVTIRLYKKDIETFRNYTKHLSQKECFEEMLNLWVKLRKDEDDGELLVFDTYINNEFKQDESMPYKIFSIMGKKLGGFGELIDIDRDSLWNECRLSRIDLNSHIVKSGDYESEKIKKWCKAIEEEFGIPLNIDEDLHRIDVQLELKCTIVLNMYWDLERKKYLVEDIFKIREIRETKDENICKQLDSRRYRYISSKKELERILNKERYLLFNVEEKKDYYYSMFSRPIIPPENLEEELEIYYNKKECKE